MNEGDIVLFQERQSLTKAHPGVQIVLIACVVIAWYGFIQQIVFGIPFGSKTSDEAMIFAWIIAGLGIPALIQMTYLDTVVTPDELIFQYRPVHLSPRVIPKAAITSTHADVYHPLATYSGWGISTRHGITSYTIGGNQGVYVTYHTKRGKEKTILIGSQNADALQQALQSSKKH